jgi:hypothetical protein
MVEAGDTLTAIARIAAVREQGRLMLMRSRQHPFDLQDGP